MVVPMVGTANGRGGLWSVCFGLEDQGYMTCVTYEEIPDIDGRCRVLSFNSLFNSLLHSCYNITCDNM